MPSFKVSFVPMPGQLEGVVQQYDNVEIFFNQFGWLTFTNHRREIVACCNPVGVQHVSQLNADVELVDEGDIIEVETNDVVNPAGLRVVN